METRNKLIVGAVGAAAVMGIGAGVGVAAAGDEDRPLTGNTYDRAAAAALQRVGEGTVTETEAGDGGAAYEVEIRLSRGGEVEVQLDENFKVIGSEADDDGAHEAEGSEDSD